MKLGIMQPYFFPYLGYWQLMNIVDKYVIYDDVNYIKGGWINRNRILNNGEAVYFNLPILGASPNKLINEIEVNQNNALTNKNLRMLQNCYCKAPYFDSVYPLLEKILKNNQKNLALYLADSIKVIAEYLDINTTFILSSELKKNNELRGQNKVIDICRLMGASEYYNAIGGQELYSFAEFDRNNIKLNFIKSDLREYKQYKNEFIEGLSIIDVLMFNSKEECKKMLNDFSIISKKKGVKMKKILVFGASGDTGKYFINYLLEHNKNNEYEIIASGSRKTDYFENKKVEYYQVDITKKTDFINLPSDIYAVVDLAGAMPARMKGYDPYKYIDVNITGTLNILEFCKENNVDRILYAQSFGDIKDHAEENPLLRVNMERKFSFTTDHTIYVMSKKLSQNVWY